MHTHHPHIEPAHRHPSPFASPVIALAMACAIGAAALFANYLRGDILHVLDEDSRVNEFEYILGHSKLREDFRQDDWEYTVVAPTDQAFDKAQWVFNGQAGGLTTAETIEPGYYNISAYDYVVSSPLDPEDIRFGEHVRVPSLSGNDLVFSRVGHGDQDLRVNGKPVQTVQVADNGVIYVIDDIIPFSPDEPQISWANPQ